MMLVYTDLNFQIRVNQLDLQNPWSISPSLNVIYVSRNSELFLQLQKSQQIRHFFLCQQ